MTSLRITIDPVACDAYGYCAELLPEAIVLDEWGYPMVNGQPLPAELAAAAKRAARDCPTRAITLREKKAVPPAARVSVASRADLRRSER